MPNLLPAANRGGDDGNGGDDSPGPSIAQIPLTELDGEKLGGQLGESFCKPVQFGARSRRLGGGESGDLETLQPAVFAAGCDEMQSDSFSEDDGTRTRNHRIDSVIRWFSLTL